MEATVKQYETAVNNAIEISQVILDMDAGGYVLAVFSELLQELMDEGNASGAASVVRKLHEITEVPFEPVELDEDRITTWISLFSEALDEVLDEEIF